MNSSLPEPPSAPVGSAVPAPAGVHRLYRRLGRLGFRWLYVLDALVVLASGAVVMTVRFGFDWPQPGGSVLGLVAFTVLVQVAFYFGGLYERQSRLGQRQWFARVAGLTLVALGVSALVVLPTDRYAVPRWNLVAVGVLVALAATGNRMLSRRLRAGRFGPPRVLLVGDGDDTAMAAEHLGETDRAAVVVGQVGPDEDVLAAADRTGASDVMLVSDPPLESVFPEPAATFETQGRGAYLRVTATTTLIGLRTVRVIGGMPYVALRATALRPSQVRLKRLSELAVLLVAGPVLLVVGGLVGLYVRLAAGPGVLYRQARTGRGGVPFTMAKFRTMSHDAEADSGPRLAESSDQRVVAGCGWLRRTRLDELPQFWHVARGEMSLVGPRPERPEMTAVFERTITGYGRRHEIAPGITGLAQTRAGYHTDAAYKLGHDLQYLMAWSPILDFQILAATLVVMLRRDP